MAESSTTTSTKASWTLSESAFRRFLDWLDDGDASDGRRYLEMRDRLVFYFDRKNCLNPDELADETLNRVARRLDEEGEIHTETPAKYCYVVARFVFLEHLRGSGSKTISLNEAITTDKSSSFHVVADDEAEQREHLFACLDKCIKTLDPSRREMILKYYLGDQRAKLDNRSALAASLGITANALAIRACRTRNKLETCVGECAGRNVS